MTQPIPTSSFELEYPQSVGVFDTYVGAQKAVDYLADQKFPVENLAIVGTNLRLVERVTGRRTWGTVLLQGVFSGISTGLMIALLMWLFLPTTNVGALLLTALAIGIAVSVIFAAIAYALSGGKRDFDSVAKTVATTYEVLCEHKVAAQARELLQNLPGARAAMFNQPPPAAQPPAYQPPAGTSADA